MEKMTTRVPYLLIIVFLFLTAGIITAGYFYYHNYERHYRLEVERGLSAVAELKTGELVQYQKERLDDGNIFFHNSDFSTLVRRLFENSEDLEARSKLRIWLSRVQVQDQYDGVFLLDDRSNVRMAIPDETTPISVYISHRAVEVLRTGEVTLQDFYRNENNERLYLSILVPILDEPYDTRFIGTLVLRIDPEKHLYPFISRWPTSGKTGETLIVRREGNEAVFLNELRFQKNTALNLRRSLDHEKMPAAQAALGREGIMEGIDYRGVPVIAYVRTIPNSPWFLVARMDISEIYAPVRERRWMVVVFIGTLIASSAAGVGLVRRQEHLRYYKEKYKASEALQESEARFRILFEQAAIGAAQIETATGRFVRINQKYCDIVGYSREEMERLDFQTITLPDDLPADLANMERIKSGEIREFTQEKRYTRKNGALVWVNITVSPMWATGRTPDYHIAMVQDITERKKQDEELRAKNAELQRFIYTISHDLKSPLVTVKTFTGYLEQDMSKAAPDRVKQDIHFIRTAADKMSRLLDELLEMSRIGRVVNPPVKVTFRELIDEALNAVAGLIDKYRVDVRVEDRPVFFFADRPRLVQIWQNLLENACKFLGEQKEPRLDIGIEEQDGETIFFVRDNGMGIDPRYQSKVFGLFEKLDAKSEGTGLGLAMVKQIVEFYGGKIRIESDGQQGRGANFLFTLPKALKIT